MAFFTSPVITRQVTAPCGSVAVTHWPADAAITLLFVHGWGGARHQWASLASAMAGRYGVVTMDLGGHGESPAGDAPWSIDRFAADVVSVMDALSLKNVVLIGHSMGGAVVTEAAIARPSVVKAVILVDTFIFDYGHVGANDRETILAGIAANLPEAVRGMVASTTPVGTPVVLRESIVAVMSQLDVRVGVPAFADLLEWDAETRWPLLRGIPVYAVNGDLINADARCRHADVIHEVVLPGTGHFLQLEAPERFQEVLVSVLGGAVPAMSSM